MKILDRRIGQRNSQLTEENKGEKRFIFQQKKLAEKKDAEIGGFFRKIFPKILFS